MGASGYDETAWVKLLSRSGRVGPYLRGLEDGVVQAGDPITVEERPEHDVSVNALFRALTTEPGRLPTLLSVEGLKPWVYEKALAFTHRGSPTSQ